MGPVPRFQLAYNLLNAPWARPRVARIVSRILAYFLMKTYRMKFNIFLTSVICFNGHREGNTIVSQSNWVFG